MKSARKKRAPEGTRLLAVRPVSYLPNDPAGQQTTGHKQGSSAERNQRSATRARERATRCSGSRATAATAATAASGRRSGAVNVDHDVLRSRSRAEARQDLLLVDMEGLGSASNRADTFASLVLSIWTT